MRRIHDTCSSTVRRIPSAISPLTFRRRYALSLDDHGNVPAFQCGVQPILLLSRQKFDEDTTVALQYDLTSTQQVISEEEKSINRLNFLLNLIDR